MKKIYSKKKIKKKQQIKHRDPQYWRQPLVFFLSFFFSFDKSFFVALVRCLIFPYIHQSVRPSVCPFVYLSNHPSIYISVCLSQDGPCPNAQHQLSLYSMYSKTYLRSYFLLHNIEESMSRLSSLKTRYSKNVSVRDSHESVLNEVIDLKS